MCVCGVIVCVYVCACVLVRGLLMTRGGKVTEFSDFHCACVCVWDVCVCVCVRCVRCVCVWDVCVCLCVCILGGLEEKI